MINFILILLMQIVLGTGLSYGDNSKIKVIEFAIAQPFSTSSSTASTRYKENFENAVYYAIGKNEEKLNKCGYKYQIKKYYYSSYDLMEAISVGEKIEHNNFWFMMGPTRAKQCIAINRNVKFTPIFALNSSSETCVNTSGMILGTSFLEHDLSNALLDRITKKEKVMSYGVVSDVSCPECESFKFAFEKNALKYSLVKKFDVNISGLEYSKNITPLLIQLKKNHIDALLIPNYSKYSGYLMSQIHKNYPHIIFLGGDGWGQGEWSYLPYFNLPESVNAYGVRTVLPIHKSGDVNSLDIVYKGKEIPPSELALSAISVIDLVSEYICRNKIQSKKDLLKLLSKESRDFARKNADIAIYKLKSGKMTINEF